MGKIVLLCGALFGMVAIVGGPVGEPIVKLELGEQLRAKTKMVPGPLLPNGERGPDEMEISPIDRQESERRLENYQLGVRYVMYHALALTALGIVGSGGYGQLMGAVGFVLGTILYGGGLIFSAVLDMPALQIGLPVGAIFLLLGWGGLASSPFQAPKDSSVATV